MKQAKAPWKNGVVLVCHNERSADSSKSSCGREDGDKLRKWLKQRLRQDGGACAKMRVLSTSCLGLCPAKGIAVAVVPGEVIHVVDPLTDKELLVAAVKRSMPGNEME